jgi:uncharacterized protein (TIGR02246 family)
VEHDVVASLVAADLTAQLVSAWAAHDIAAFASLFHEDAAFITVIGSYARGRAEIEQLHAAAHAGIFAASTIAMDVEDARRAADGVVVAHVTSVMLGDARAPDEPGPSILTLLIESRGGPWLISAAQNTNVAPPPRRA